MAQLNTLLELRNQIKNKKPLFIRQDTHKRKRLDLKWRKPKGIHSKIRHHFKGRRKMPSPGYGSPRKVKGMHASGLKIMNVVSAEGFKEIKKEKEGIIIPKSIGFKKRLQILKRAKDLGISVLNHNIDDQIKKIEEFINSKRKAEIKEIKKEAKKENASEKKSNEDKKESEKREKDKILTKRV